MTPQHQYEKETGKSVWKIKDHTYTDEYSAWIKNYAKNSYSPDAKIIREFSNKLKQKAQSNKDNSERLKWFESPNAEGYLDM